MSNKLILDILEILIKQDCAWEPLCDVSFTEEEIIVELDVPSLDINKLSINIVNGSRIEILGEKKRVKTKDGVYLAAERVFGKFKKMVDLPFQSNNKVKKVEYNNGILKITITRSET